jgi:hypothetical protein
VATLHVKKEKIFGVSSGSMVLYLKNIYIGEGRKAMIPFSLLNVVLMAAVFLAVCAVFAVCIRRELK